MEIDNVKAIIDGILQTKSVFDSHDFIRAYMKSETKDYGQMLVKYKDVRQTHSIIANYLLDNSKKLGIEKTVKESISRDVFDIETPCAEWKSLTK